MRFLILALGAAAAALSAPAGAGELFGGAYVHDVDTPLTKSGFEGGADLQIGWRGERLRGLKAIGRPSPYVLASVHTGGDTHFASAGLGWKIGRTLYLRPAVGIAIHSGSAGEVQRRDRIAFGSRILFQPEIGIGYRLGQRTSVEASWIHLSHAQLFGPQNPGMDSFGLRLNHRLR